MEDKVWEYLVTHNTPVRAETLAKRFLASESRISRILKQLADKGILEVVKVGTQKFYRIKE